METIAVSQFRSNVLQILKKIQSGKEVLITSHGTPVAKLVPPEDIALQAEKRLEEIRKTAILHDVISPIDTTWDAMT